MSDNNGHKGMKLVLQGVAPDQPDVVPDIDPTTRPYGQQLTRERQERFLDGFGRFGTVTKAVQAAGININTVQYWDKGDKLGFTERYRHTRRAFVDRLENMVLDRLDEPQGNRGSGVLLIARLNKEDPQHWTRNLKLTHEVPNELIQQLRQLQGLSTQEPKTTDSTDSQIVEGESRALPWD